MESMESMDLDEQMRERRARIEQQRHPNSSANQNQDNHRDQSEPMDIDEADSTAEHEIMEIQRKIAARHAKLRRLEDMKQQLLQQQREIKRKLASVNSNINREQSLMDAERKQLEDLLSTSDEVESVAESLPRPQPSPNQNSFNARPAAVSAAEQARLDEELARSLQMQYDREEETFQHERQQPQQAHRPQRQHRQQSAQRRSHQSRPQVSVRTFQTGPDGHSRQVSFFSRSGGSAMSDPMSIFQNHPFFSSNLQDSDEDEFGTVNVQDPFNLLGARGFGFGPSGTGSFMPIHFGMPMGMLNIDNMDHEQLLRLFPPRPRGARQEDIQQLPTDTFHARDKPNEEKEETEEKKQELNDENRKCCICLEEFKEGETIRRLPCMHIFHQDEIDRWLRTNHICPICRSPIEQNEVPAT